MLGSPTVHLQIGASAADRKTVGVDDPDVNDALHTYHTEDYKRINNGLRRSKGKKTEAEVTHMDKAMKDSTLRDDVVIYRGMNDSRKMFPGTEKGQDLTGVRWQDQAFVSTTHFDEADHIFTGVTSRSKNLAPVQMRILAPAGTHALSSHNLDPDELLLDRGLTFQVVRDHGTDDAGLHNIDVLVVPA